jgi:hypothetical protein
LAALFSNNSQFSMSGSGYGYASQGIDLSI